MPKLEDIFNPRLVIPKSPSLNIGRIVQSSSHSIYPLCHLNKLLELIKAKDDEPLVVRYLVDTGGAIWFAPEGKPNSTIIPEHYKMTGEKSSSARCLAAGNITFSPDGKKIISINHKSGDFHPPFESLKFPLTILVTEEEVLAPQGITLADDLHIEKLMSSGGVESVLTVKKEELIPVVMAQDLTKLRSQPSAIKCVAYDSPIRDASPLRSDEEAASADRLFSFKRKLLVSPASSGEIVAATGAGISGKASIGRPAPHGVLSSLFLGFFPPPTAATSAEPTSESQTLKRRRDEDDPDLKKYEITSRKIHSPVRGSYDPSGDPALEVRPLPGTRI